MPENGRSEREAQGFHEPRTSRVGLGVLALLSTISVVVAAVWVMGPDARSHPKTLSSPSPAASPSPVVDPVDLHERTIYLWDTASRIVRPLLSGRHGLANPELAPDGGSVIFEHDDADGDTQIYLPGADGTDRRLTDIPGGASDPAWSSDGRIAFAATPRHDGDNPEADTDIFVMDADGSHVRRLAGTPQNDGAPDWSPDGQRIVFHSEFDDGRGLLWITSAGSHALDRLTPRGGWSAMDPAWSPDGRWIAFSRYFHWNTLNGRIFSGELALTHPDGTGTRLVAKPPKGRSSGRVWTEPSWSPDGRLILFEERRWDDTRGYIQVIDPWASRTPEYVRLDSWVPLDPNWSQGGIVFVWNNDGGSPTPRYRPFAFEPAPSTDALGIDATIRMTGERCEVVAYRRVIHHGTFTLELINDSDLDARFTLVRLGTLRDLRLPSLHLRSPLAASLDPSTSEVWSSKMRVGAGRWAVVCRKDASPGPYGFIIVPVGVAGPIDVV